jgi:hypothetical protein
MGQGGASNQAGGNKYSLSNMNTPQGEKYTLGGLDDPQAGNQYGLSGSLEELAPLGSDNPIMQEILKLQEYGFNPGAPGHGGQTPSTRPPAIPGLGGGAGTGTGTKPGGGSASGGGGNSMANLAAMGLLGSVLGDAFKGDDKPAPAPATGGGYGAGLPTYGSLIGMATTRDAIKDQENRLKYAGRTA